LTSWNAMVSRAFLERARPDSTAKITMSWSGSIRSDVQRARAFLSMR
jgi:hypothetical protein